MQVCLGGCHTVGTEASGLFPGCGASSPATTGALWAGSSPEAPRLEVEKKVQVCWELQVEMEREREHILLHCSETQCKRKQEQK